MLRSPVFLLCLCLSGAVAANESLRPEFKAALQAVEAGGNPVESAALRGYVLYPYLQAARLRQALKAQPGEALDGRIAAFLDEAGEQPAAKPLRREWLLSLAQRQQWSTLLAKDDPGTSDDALRCHRYNAWLQTGGVDNSMRDEILASWMTGQQLSQACVAPFQWLQQQGLLTPERLEQRARLALEEGNPDLADWLLRGVPEARAAPLQRWARLLREPRPAIEALIATPSATVEWAPLEAAWAKLARKNADEMAPLLPKLIDKRRPDARQIAELRRDLAMGHALDRKPEALALYRQVPDEVLDDKSHEWRVRAALWHGNWELASQWLHSMPPAQAAEPRWSYWRARAQEALGRRAQAEPIYATLMQEGGYYAVLSAWRLQRKLSPITQTLVSDPGLQQQLLTQPPVQRARELFLIGRADLANAEWRLALQGADELTRVQAARLASAWGWHVQAVGMLNQMNLTRDLELLYPQAYTKEIEAGARFAGIPGPWIYGVMRQESLFLPAAVSKSQALGLLQLLLPTAQQVARKWQRPQPTREDLFDPAINIPLGAAYLRDQTDRFGGRFILTLGAYNAGPNAVARWLPAQPRDADIWIENVP
ncbi:MAG TPA: transglycosylase SLT domain-containing protein, partial [Solimonas sp.]|nr:transglycosylase SLT domain-containing protein [Solimonas sp.]